MQFAIITTLSVLGTLIIILLGVFIADIIGRRKSEKKYHTRETVMAYVLMIPAIILVFIFVILPIFFSLSYAFTDFHTSRFNEIDFVGFDQFIKLFKEFFAHKAIYQAFMHTGFFVIFVVPLQIGLALLLALFCNNKRRGTTIFKVCFFAPVAVSLSVTVYLWTIILSSDPNGMMNSFLRIFGIQSQDFFEDGNKILMWMVIMSAWQGCGYQMLIFLSALGNIRKDLYEAARVDGANAFQRFKTVTLPGLKPTFLFILITVFVGACRVLVQPMLLARNDPRAMTISLFMYEKGMDDERVGYSCAVALIMTIIIGSITFIQRRLLGEKKK